MALIHVSRPDTDILDILATLKLEDKMGEEKECFVICPIGEEESPIRERSNQLLRYVFEPVANKCAYRVIRADKISEPGIITRQIIERIIERIIESPLVIADLTGHNPNVFYELALRHAIRKPLVQVIQKGELLPFDIITTRVIHVDYPDPDGMEEAKKELERQIEYAGSALDTGQLAQTRSGV